MPRQKKFKPIAQEQLEVELRDRYGGMMTAAAVGRELGLTHQYTYVAWLKDVPYVNVNGRKRYRCADVAEKIYMSTTTEGEAS